MMGDGLEGFWERANYGLGAAAEFKVSGVHQKRRILGNADFLGFFLGPFYKNGGVVVGQASDGQQRSSPDLMRPTGI